MAAVPELEAFASATDDALYREAGGVVRWASGRLRELLGADPTGRSLLEWVVEADRPRLEAARRDLVGAARLELRMRLPGGAGSEVAPVLDLAARDGEAVVGALRDLRPARAGLEAARLEAQADLAAGVAHEVNNPLSGVLNYALLVQRFGGVDARTVEALEGIASEARRIEEITRSLQALARRGDGAAALGDLVRGALASVRRQLRDELTNLEVDVPPDLPPVRSRGHDLALALRLLIDGARAALGARFPRRDPQKRLVLRARADDDGDAALLEVEEGSGAGPDPVLVERCAALLAPHGRAELVRGDRGALVRLRLALV